MQQDCKVLLDLLELKVFRALPDRLEQQGHKVLPELKVFQVLPDRLEQQGRKVPLRLLDQ